MALISNVIGQWGGQCSHWAANQATKGTWFRSDGLGPTHGKNMGNWFMNVLGWYKLDKPRKDCYFVSTNGVYGHVGKVTSLDNSGQTFDSNFNGDERMNSHNFMQGNEWYTDTLVSPTITSGQRSVIMFNYYIVDKDQYWLISPTGQLSNVDKLTSDLINNSGIPTVNIDQVGFDKVAQAVHAFIK